jgi:hypothetical protein
MYSTTGTGAIGRFLEVSYTLPHPVGDSRTQLTPNPPAMRGSYAACGFAVDLEITRVSSAGAALDAVGLPTSALGKIAQLSAPLSLRRRNHTAPPLTRYGLPLVQNPAFGKETT